MSDLAPTLLPRLSLSDHTAKEILSQQGKNRAAAEHCQIRANNDIEAIHCWLNEYRTTKTTYRNYQKEAQRLLLWCAMAAKKTFSDLDRDDFERYSHFLSDPQPYSLWCGPRTKCNEQWKPFVAGLSSSARATAMTILHSLMTYLVEADYLKKNPLALLRKKVTFHADSLRRIKSLERKLERDEISALLNAIEAMPENDTREIFDKHRTRFLIYLLALTGIRDNELVTHHWNNFHFIQHRWWLLIVGKANKPRLVPVTDELLQEIKRYRLYLKKAPYPLQEDTTSLITHHQQNKSITTRQINNILHSILRVAAEQFKDQRDKYERMIHLSAHGFRHVNASLQEQADISLVHIRDNLGHSDIKTTSIYLHSSDLARHEQLQKVRLSALQFEKT